MNRDTQSVQILPPFSGPPTADQHGRRDATDFRVLQAQRWPRARVALVVAVAQGILILLAGGARQHLVLLAVATIVYAALSLMVFPWHHQPWRMSAGVTAQLAADVAFVLLVTALGTAPLHYERALLGEVIVVSVANHDFSGRQTRRAALMAFLGFLILLVLTSEPGNAVNLAEALWSLAVATAFAMVVMTRMGDVRFRLDALMELFGQAERGDFRRSYEEESDTRADLITRVGHAFNRVSDQLSSMVLSDPLTGCLNRRGFEQAYAREVARSARAGSDLGLLVLDLDHFKLVNDTYGHPAGDAVLRSAGQLLMEACRAGDIVARVGGEEFALLLPDTGDTGSFQFASRLCTAIREHPFPSHTPFAPPIRVTTSIGMASRIPHRGIDEGENGLSARADEALYAAKRTGRDRVRVWSQELQGGGRRVLDSMPAVEGDEEGG